MKRVTVYAALAMAACLCFAAQQPRRSGAVGTVVAIHIEPFEIQWKDDAGKTGAAKLSGETQFRVVEPGERDLKNSKEARITDVIPGDRVLVTFAADGETARRVIVMSARSIASRNDADQADWKARGIAGVVESRKDGAIILRLHSLADEAHATVVVDGKTRFRRYAPGSVKFADAVQSDMNAVARGDQLRARGVKSADGLTVQAEEVVFGTFLTRAGKVVSVNVAAGEVVMKNVADDKPLTVKVTADSQLKRMPAMPFAGGAHAGPPPGPRAGGPPDLSRMIERMPAARIEEIQPGETIVVSSTKQGRPDQLTAIVLLENAEFLVRMASARASANERGQSQNSGMQQGMSMGMGGMTGGLGGLDLPGMLQ